MTWMARVGAVVLGSVAAASVAMGQGIAFERAQHLQHGINLSMWYAQARDYSAERLASYTNDADFKLVRSLGFDSARLSINPVPLIADQAAGTLRPEAMARLDKTVAEITATGLVVVLDIHPEKDYEDALLKNDGDAQNFLKFWTAFASHYAKTDPTHVYFEILNEPEISNDAPWEAIQTKAVAAIRQAAPHHTIIATGAQWGGISGLTGLTPLADDNIIYSFHDYDPMWFTHQGASWAGSQFEKVRGVPYPSSPETVAPLLGMETDAAGKAGLQHYGEEHWNAERVDAGITKAADWGTAHHVPVWCGEFGVYKTYSDPAMRAAWIRDMRVALEAHSIGWAMWDYQGGFALVDKADGKTTVNQAVVAALGLKPAAADDKPDSHGHAKDTGSGSAKE